MKPAAFVSREQEEEREQSLEREIGAETQRVSSSHPEECSSSSDLSTAAQLDAAQSNCYDAHFFIYSSSAKPPLTPPLLRFSSERFLSADLLSTL
ncbi:hypothetical protein INR49_008020 [Caranx melampygus]|nr:hypothetical protein INR49_008020 [Caranx melampygus]